MKDLTISQNADKIIFEKAKSEILRQLTTNKEEGFRIEASELTDVDSSKVFIVRGLANGIPLLKKLALYYDLTIGSVYMSSEDEIENYINIDTFKNNVLAKKRVRNRRY